MRNGYHPRVFGCMGYVHFYNPPLDKLSAKTLKRVFVGYSNMQKGYKCYYPMTWKILVTKDEHQFFHSSETKEVEKESEEHREIVRMEILTPIDLVKQRDTTQFLNCLKSLPSPSGPGGTRGSAHFTILPFGMEALSPLEDQSFRLAPHTTKPDDKGTAAANGSELSGGVPTMCRGSGGLLTFVLRLPSDPGSVVGG